MANSCEFLLFFIHLLIICKLISPAVLSGMTNVVKEQKSKVRIGKRTTISDVSGVKYRKEMELDRLLSTMQSMESRNSLIYQLELIDQLE